MNEFVNGQIDENEKTRFDKKEKARRSLVLLVFIVLFVNAFYFYESHRLGGIRTHLLDVIEIFNIFMSFGIYAVIVTIVRNDVTYVSCFLRETDKLMSSNDSWGSGQKSLRFVEQYRMYSELDELKKDVENLKYAYSKHRFWLIISVIALLPFLLCNSVDVLFCGKSARIMMIWTDDVAFYLFYVPKCLFSLILIVSLSLFMFYKDKVKTIVTDPTKTKLILKDVSDLLWIFTSDLYKRLLVFL